LAEGGIRTRLGQASPLGVATFAGSSTNRLGASVVRNSTSSMAVATAEVEVAAPPAKLEELEEHKVINDHGLILPHVPESARASAFLQGKVDALPSTLSAEDLMAQQSAISDRTSSVEKDVGGKRVAFEIFFMSEFATKGGWWLDVEVTYQKQKTTHCVIVGKDFAEAVGKDDPRDIVENAFAVLLARRVPMHTEGMITSEVFPVNYFTATNVATQFPEFLELFGSNSEKFDWDRAQWNFKQVHDYSQDDKRTMPSPLGGVFDPLALQ